MKEKDLQRMVNEFLRKANVFFYHPRETKKGTDGIPDIIACINGRFIAIELKSPELKNPEKHLRPEQETIRDKIIRSGGIYFISNDFDKIVDFINFQIKHI